MNKELIIIKVGTNTVVDHDYDTLHHDVFSNISTEIRELQEEGYDVVLVSSGAVSAGVLSDAKKREHVDSTVELQRYAARGWDILVQNWKTHLGSECVSSTLLTKRELHNEPMRAQICQVILCCLSHGDTFLVNENDTISNDEITFGDNDQLATELAIALQKEAVFSSITLVLLTNTNGLYADINNTSSRITTVHPGDDVSRYIIDSQDTHSRGGMASKLYAATRASANNIEVYIADGRATNTVHQALTHTAGTRFIVAR
ncbi:MAG: hypothetical protein WAS27_00810 [Candidatus Saccharimonadales bacterium]